MKLTREQAINLLLEEREYQERTFEPDELLPSGLTRAQRDSELPSHLNMLASYLREAQDNWTWDYKRGTDEVYVLQQVAKIGAIALRALERVGFASELLKRGLRDQPAAQPERRELNS